MKLTHDTRNSRTSREWFLSHNNRLCANSNLDLAHHWLCKITKRFLPMLSSLLARFLVSSVFQWFLMESTIAFARYSALLEDNPASEIRPSFVI